jgi:SPOR domain
MKNGGSHLHAALLLATVLLWLAACSTSTKTTTTGYSEDLTPNRPVFSVSEKPVKTADTDIVVKKTTPSKNVNAKVDVVLDSIDRINLTRRYFDGYTIQVYSGQRREDAMNVKQKIVNEASDLSSSLQYVQPKFRVTVGKYVTKLEAQRDLVRLKRYFSSAILVPEKIVLK